MRIRTQAVAGLLFFLALILSFSSPLSRADETRDPPDDLWSSGSDTLTEAERIKSLVPLDEMISPEAQGRIDANRFAYRERLQRLVRGDAVRGHVDLRFRDTPVKKQFGGTCSSFGLIGAMENLLGGKIELSERHLWSQYKKYSSERAVKAASTGNGAVELDWWPSEHHHPFKGYLDQPWFKLKKFASLDGDISKMIESLDHEYPVYVAIRTPADMMKCPVHIDPHSPPYKKSGHALAVVGYEINRRQPGGGAFLLKNSWGPQCADGGYQWFPFALCMKDQMYCQFWSIQEIQHD